MPQGSTGAILLVGKPDECTDIQYGSGFRAPDPVVFLKAGRHRHIVVPELEYGRANSSVQPGLHVWTPGMLGIRGPKRQQLGEWALALLREHRIRSVTVPAQFPFGVAQRLVRGRVKVTCSTGDIFPQRRRKTAAEIEHIRHAQRAAVIAMRSAIAMIGESQSDRSGVLHLGRQRLTSERIRRRILDVLLDHDCFCRDTICAGGAAAAEPHERGTGPLRTGEAIVIDIFPRNQENGYWGDITRTVVHGIASPELRRMYQAVKAAHRAALQALRPGVQSSTVHAAAADMLIKRGFETRLDGDQPVGFIHSTGHGVGLDVHEGPRVGPVKERLCRGHVITIEPGLYYPEIGGIRLEDTVVLTDSGWRYLAPCEKRFEV